MGRRGEDANATTFPEILGDYSKIGVHDSFPDFWGHFVGDPKVFSFILRWVEAVSGSNILHVCAYSRCAKNLLCIQGFGPTFATSTQVASMRVDTRRFKFTQQQDLLGRTIREIVLLQADDE